MISLADATMEGWPPVGLGKCLSINSLFAQSPGSRKLAYLVILTTLSWEYTACGNFFRMPRSLRLPYLEQKSSFIIYGQILVRIMRKIWLKEVNSFVP